MKRNELFDNFLNDSLTDKEHDELINRLQEDENSEKFVNYIIETNLMINAAENASQNSSNPKKKSPILFIIGAVAAILLISFLILIPKTQNFEIVSSTFANFSEGQTITNDRIKLAEGELSIKMQNGILLELHAPIDLEFKTSNSINLLNGTLSAKLPPPVKNFKVHTKHGTVEDLGTAFGLQVKDESAYLSVYEGMVRVDLANKKTKLKVGQAINFTIDGYEETIYTDDITTIQNTSQFNLGNRELRPGQNMNFKLDTSAKLIKSSISMRFDNDKNFKYKLLVTAKGKKIFESPTYSAKDINQIAVPLNNQGDIQFELKAVSGSIENGILEMKDIRLLTDGYRPYEGNLLIPNQSEWSYKFEGLPEENWMQVDFNDNTWSKGKASIGYGDHDLQTRIGPDELRHSISKIYLRKNLILEISNWET